MADAAARQLQYEYKAVSSFIDEKSILKCFKPISVECEERK